jgi:hypothetical protein
LAKSRLRLLNDSSIGKYPSKNVLGWEKLVESGRCKICFMKLNISSHDIKLDGPYPRLDKTKHSNRCDVFQQVRYINQDLVV